ncbi:translocation protein TolB [Neobacillus sp. DY30]|uniref:translocation protein TolB n=1 Tax=Neobacillus sp. DY30 TaxID=3047871 RepID=UPI0024C029D3|nr:translocation protein TolB [Neobacillus sp. DY30]WHY01032.1 translocation protein TolB [Neobacillus sp. DY30]
MFFLIIAFLPVSSSAEPKENLKAAFVRNDHLWIKLKDNEIQITDTGYVRYPKWSFDGSWVAYLKGAKEGDIMSLWLYNIKSNRHFRVKENVGVNFQWSPNANTIGFQAAKNLVILHTSQLNLFTPAAKNIENFSWLPSGKGLLISTKKSPELHSDIILSNVIFRKKGMPFVKDFYTIKINENEIYASTSAFNWSKDKKWISFLLIPTASLSADGNTLCLLSTNGKKLLKIDEMLNEPAWIQWAPYKGSLGYISGVGREAALNKRLKVLTVPSIKNLILTPKGFVDRDLTWQNNRTIIVSRSLENSSGDLSESTLPRLYKISLSDNKQTQITFPSEKDGNFKPEIVKNNLFWIRTDRKHADVMISPTYNSEEMVWIKNINPGSSFYEKWSWDEVFSLYSGR